MKTGRIGDRRDPKKKESLAPDVRACLKSTGTYLGAALLNLYCRPLIVSNNRADTPATKP